MPESPVTVQIRRKGGALDSSGRRPRPEPRGTLDDDCRQAAARPGVGRAATRARDVLVITGLGSPSPFVN